MRPPKKIISPAYLPAIGIIVFTAHIQANCSECNAHRKHPKTKKNADFQVLRRLLRGWSPAIGLHKVLLLDCERFLRNDPGIKIIEGEDDLPEMNKDH